MYDESEVKAILHRAIELDATRADSMTRNDIVQVASELGVSEASVDEAIRDLRRQSGERALQSTRVGQLSPLRILNVSAGAGVLCGLFTPGVSGVGTGLVGTGLWAGLLMLSGGLAFTDRSRSLSNFVRRNTAAWLGVGFGWIIWAEAMIRQPTISIQIALIRSATALVVTTIAGSAFILITRSFEKRERSGADSGGGRNRLARIVSRLRQWLLDRLGTTAVVFSRVRTARRNTPAASRPAF